MLRTIATKTLYDQRRALIGWGLGLVLLVAMYVSMWPSLRDQPSMHDFLDRMPRAFRALFAATGADMSTAVGYVQVELLSFMGPLLLLMYAITSGAAAVAGEEDRHTADLLLANPVSRRRVVLEKFGAMAAGVVTLCGATGVALLAEGAMAGMRLPAGHVLAAVLHLGLLALVFGALALAVGGLTGQIVLSRAVPALVAVVAYVINGLGSIVSWLRPLRPGSPFYQYIGHDPLRNGASLTSVGISLATVAVLLAVSVETFRRRDIAT